MCLFDLFYDAFGLFPAQSYSLESTAALDNDVLQIMSQHPRSEFKKETKNDSKKKWSDESFDIAKQFGYSLKEGDSPSTEFILKGDEIVKKQLALAGYRLSNLISYMMSKQKGETEIRNRSYKRRSK